MRAMLAVVVLLATSAPTAQAHNNKWLFLRFQVLSRQVQLSQSLNYFFHGVTHVAVQCQGLQPERTTSGGTGYVHIYCITSIGPRGYMYHHLANGDVVVTRPIR